MNNATATAGGEAEKAIDGFPTIRPGHFYKLQQGDTKVVAFCRPEGKFEVKAGSVIDMEPWPNCLEPGYKDPTWVHISMDLAARDCIYKKNPDFMAFFGKDYDGASPLEMAQVATGSEDVDPAKLWVEVFD